VKNSRAGKDPDDLFIRLGAARGVSSIDLCAAAASASLFPPYFCDNETIDRSSSQQLESA